MKALSKIELSTFCGQFALILRSGISSLEGLAILQEDSPEGEGQELLEQLYEHLELTGSLSEALEQSGAFPPYLCSMVELGEQSGRLDDVMQSLSEHYRREDALTKNIKNAVTYPLIMLGMMLVVMAVLIVKVLPIFSQVFDQLGADLTGISATILSLGNVLSGCSTVLIVVGAVLLVLCLLAFGTAKGQKILGRMAGKFVLTRKLAEQVACSRFASGMYLALASGLDIDQSLEMVQRLVDHPLLNKKIGLVREMTAEGGSFSDAITETEIFSGIHARMVSIGGKTGSMDEIMHQISLQYDEDVQDRIASLLSKIEPTLVAILSVMVGLILLSVMLPLMGVMSNIG